MNDPNASHELYNAGHLFEAAAAHYQATGKTNLLNVAIKEADLLCQTFGPGTNQLHLWPGHEIVEMGLAKLYRVTGDPRYLNLAKYFIDVRGTRPAAMTTTSRAFRRWTRPRPSATPCAPAIFTAAWPMSRR